jgi:hypothetical protein
MIKEQDLLEKTIQKIDDIARERIQANLTLKLAQQKLISDPDDLETALKSIKEDIDLYIEIKRYAQQILQASYNKRQIIIDKLRETVRLSYEYEKQFYNRNSCKLIEYPYMHNLFNLLQPFISYTQKHVENAMQLSIKRDFCGYKLDYMDKFLDISTFLQEYKTFLRKLNSNPTYSNLAQQLALQLQSIIKVFNDPQTMSELYDNVYEFCQIQNIFYEMSEYFSSEQDPESQKEKKPESKSESEFESKRKTKQPTTTCTQKETIAQDSKDVPLTEPKELSLPTTNTTITPTRTIEDNSLRYPLISEEYKSKRAGLKSVSDTHIREMLKLPEEYTIGEAIDNGGCFFDSFAQLLNTYNNTEEYTEKSLRLACCDYVSKNSSTAISLINADKNSNVSLANYDEEMSKTGKEREIPQWGRTDVEGIMLCRQLDLDKFYVYEIGKDLDGAEFYSLCQVTKEKVINIDVSDLDLNKPTLIVKDLHFVPILPCHKINNKSKRLRAYNHDKNEGIPKDNGFNLIWKQRRLDSIARLLHTQLYQQRVAAGAVAILLSNNRQGKPCFIIATKWAGINSASVREALSQLANETKILLTQIESENEDLKIESYIKYKRDQLKKLLTKLRAPNFNNYNIKIQHFLRNLRYDIDLAKLTQTIHNYVGNNKYLPDIGDAFKQDFILLRKEKKETHPELAIVDYIVNQNISREKFNYIGLSMLNCCQCHALIHGPNNTSHANRIISFNDQSTIPVYTRGFFNYRYPNYVLPLWSIQINHMQSEHDLKEQVDSLGIPIENTDLKERFLAQNADLSDSESDSETEISRCTI